MEPVKQVKLSLTDCLTSSAFNLKVTFVFLSLFPNNEYHSRRTYLATSRNPLALGALAHNNNLLSSVSHLLPPGTSISTVISLLNLLNNVNALDNDIHQIPAVLQQKVHDLLNGVQNVLPTTLQPVQGSA